MSDQEYKKVGYLDRSTVMLVEHVYKLLLQHSQAVLDLYRLDIKAFHNPNDQMYEQLQAEHESLEKEYNQALLDLVIALFYRRRKTS
jgi:hypothetical protein